MNNDLVMNEESQMTWYDASTSSGHGDLIAGPPPYEN